MVRSLVSWRVLWCVAGAVLVALLALPGVSAAQGTLATLSLIVSDETGAPVPDARVAVRADAGGVPRALITRADGTTVAALLPAGRYTVTAQRDGFVPVEARAVTLNVSDHLLLQLLLRVSPVEQAVTVVGDASGVRIAPSVATVVDRTLIEQLPLNGRSFQSLLQLTPGVVPVFSNLTRLGQFSTNGQREASNYVTVDGVSANVGVMSGVTFDGAGGQYPAFNAQGGTSSLVSLDAMEEFSVQTSSVSAEHGRTPGGQVSIVTRAGGNELRGSASEYFRHDRLDANDWFANRQGLAKARMRQHQFGGTLGGPLMRDRSHFFGSFEGLRLLLPQVVTDVEVPSMAARAAATGPIRDILRAFPDANGREVGGGLALHSSSYSDPVRSDTASGRIDHVLRPGTTMFGRYNASRSSTTTRGGGSRSLAVLSDTQFRFSSLTAGVMWAPSSRLINDLRINVTSNTAERTYTVDDYAGAAPPPNASLYPAFAAPETTELAISLKGFSGPSLLVGRAGRNVNRQINVVNTVSLAAGAHQIRAGVDYRRLLPTYDYAPYAQYLYFTDVNAAISGRAFYGQVYGFDSQLEPRFTNLSLFVQDAWTATPRLTLTMGVRGEVVPAPTEKNNRGPVTLSDARTPSAFVLAPRGAALWESNGLNIAPRAGASYLLRATPGRETVLRAGVGRYFDLTPAAANHAYHIFNYPFNAYKEFDDVAFPLTTAEATPPPFDLGPPYGPIIAFDRNLELPSTWHWNVAAEQALGSQSVSVTYVGSRGEGLYRLERYVRPTPAFTSVRVVRNDADSSYHALQFQYRRRLSRGVQALASYTLSRAIDTDSVEVVTTPGSAADSRGHADFDRRHVLSTALSWQLPSPTRPGVVRTLVGGWGVDAVFKAMSAAPVPILTNVNSLLGSFRPDTVPGASLYIDDATAPGGRYINRAAFTPRSDRHGSLDRGVLRGFGFSQLDVAVWRQVRFGDAARVQFRAEAFNALNRPNFADPVANLSQAAFGRSTQMLNRGIGGLNRLYQIGGPRSIQLSARVTF